MESRISAALRRIVRAIDLNSRHLFREFHLTGPQLAVLQELGHLNETTVGALARTVIMGAPTLTGVLDRLERQRLIRRWRSDQDRRRVYVAISDKGRRLLDRQPRLLSRELLDKLAALPEWEQTQIVSTLQRVADLIDPGTMPNAQG